MLHAVGHPDPDSGTNPAKRTRMITKIKVACSQ